MDKGHRNILAILIAAVMAVALFSAFSVNLFHKTPEVVLPSLTPLPSDVPDGPSGAGNYQRVEVTPQTVQQVVATLERPESYARTITAETLGAGGQFGVTQATVTVDGGWTQTALTLPDHRTQHSLIGGGRRYVWYGAERTWREYDAAEHSADLSQRLPTYEDVLTADKADIVHAEYALSEQLPCIYIAVLEPSTGYVESYWVSVDTGLLVHAESSKDGEVFYRMSGYTVETPATPGQSFALPDGTVMHTTALPD